MKSEAFAVVMAGGRGTRLWPVSTEKRPKQFLVLNISHPWALLSSIFLTRGIDLSMGGCL